MNANSNKLTLYIYKHWYNQVLDASQISAFVSHCAFGRLEKQVSCLLILSTLIMF